VNDEKNGGHREDSLIGFWLGTPMLVRDPVFVKQLFHFFCHHVTVIRNRDKGDLFTSFRLLLVLSATHSGRGYSNDSSEDCSGNALPQAWQVTK
jgi:hypothetical protein